jgi:hypothetical protein
MIFRRLAQNLREQNWTAIGIEFVLLVLGVFLGIQVANWNEERQQVARQSAYLERLRIDFTGIRDRIQQHFVVYRDSVEGGEFLLSIVRAGEGSAPPDDDEKARMARAYNALMSSRIPPPLPATYVEMRSEGQLSGIRNPVLRDRLAEYDRMLGLLQEVARLTGDNLNQQAPYLQRHFVSRTVVDDTAQSGIREELISHDVAGMRADRDFAVAVKLLQRNAYNSLQVRRLQLDLIENILTLIEEEQQR